jgi:hypothetical protein
VYTDVIYFFVMHETSVHTIFELLVKKHLPFFPCFMKKKISLLSIQYCIFCHNCCIVILLTEVLVLCINMPTEGIFCGTHGPKGFFEGAIFLILPGFLLMQNDV